MLHRLFPNMYEGWVVVGSSALIVTLVAAVFFYGFGTIFTPMREEFGWSAAATSLAFSLRSEVGGIAAPFVGALVDRTGPRRVLIAGLLFSAAGIFTMSLVQNIWQFYGVMMMIALGSSASGGQVGMVATVSWFEERRGRALSLMTVGAGASGLFVIGVAALVDAFGWRGALRLLAVIIVLVGLPLAQNVRQRPLGHPQPMDGRPPASGDEAREEGEPWGVPVRQAIRSRAFLFLVAGGALIGFGTTALIVHQIPFLESLDISRQTAAVTVALYTLTSVIGRLGSGYLADRYDKRLVLAGGAALVAASVPLLALTHNLWQAMAVLAVVAVGFGATIPVRVALVADYFGTKNFGAVNGITMLALTFGSFFGPLMVGAVVDVTGEYTIGWVVTGATVALAVPLILSSRRPVDLIAAYEGKPRPTPAAVSMVGATAQWEPGRQARAADDSPRRR